MARERRRKVRKRREDLTQEEIRRLKIRRKRQLMLKRKRRFYALLFVVLGLFIIMFFIRIRSDKEKETSISANTAGLPSAGASETSGAYENADNDESISGEAYEDEYSYSVSGDSAMRPNAKLDVTKGQAAINLESISGNRIEKVQAAKNAMSTVAYFPGTTKTVNDYFTEYGEGKWHGIQDAQENILVFYEGNRSEVTYETDVSNNVVAVHGPEIPFKISMIMYEDGSFVVQNVIENGSNVDNYEEYLMNIVSPSGSN